MGVTRRQDDGPANSVGDVLEWALQRDPSHESLVSNDARLTYEALDHAVERAASALSALGIGKDDVVAVSLPNESAVVITFHALMRGSGSASIGTSLLPKRRSSCAMQMPSCL